MICRAFAEQNVARQIICIVRCDRGDTPLYTPEGEDFIKLRKI
jgi:hypothetical protein